MASGRLVLPLSEPSISSAGLLVTGATLTVYQTGTMNLAALFSNAGLSSSIPNPQTSNSAGRFYTQGTEIWADASIAYDCVLAFPDGESFTYNQVYLIGAPVSTAGFAPINSPAFTGTPTAPTPSAGNNTNILATTAFVQTALATIVAATTSTAGIVALATGAQVITGTDTGHAVTPASLTSNQSLGASGYIQLPGGLLLQWITSGSIAQNSTGSVSWPTAFPNACFAVIISRTTLGGGSAGNPDTVNTKSTSGAQIGNNGGASTGSTTFYVFAVGN